MSLLQNEDFLIYQLRTSYLNHIKDGVGERLISVDPAVLLNDPGLRAAGYRVGSGGHEINRTYSPPIPVATEVSSEYFVGPSRSNSDQVAKNGGEPGGMMTGKGSQETVGPRLQVKRRRMLAQQEEDDSSDLSDESDEEEENTQRAARQIRFEKMPVRSRAGSSPLRGSVKQGGPELTVTEASRSVRGEGRLRGESLGAVDAVRRRDRRDTTTSSEMSSDNELDPAVFRRIQVRPSRSNSAGTTTQDGEEDEIERLPNVEEEDTDHNDARRASGSSLSSQFTESDDSASLLDADEGALASSSLADLMPPALNINSPAGSPRKIRSQQGSMVQALPPPRPISRIIPVSALGMAIRARKQKPKNPVESYARFNGKGALDPLNIKILAPFCDTPSKPYELPLLKSVNDSDSGATINVTVADTIGLCLWRYHEEGLKPPIPQKKLDVNRWMLRIVDDGEVEFDFPPLNRSRNITDFTTNQNKPAGRRARGGKAYDEFALVEATEAQYEDNKKITPKYTKVYEDFEKIGTDDAMGGGLGAESSSAILDEPLNTNVPKPFAFTQRKNSATLDQPTIPKAHSTPRMGPPKLLKVSFMSLEAQSQSSTIEVTTDTYLAEVLDMLCKRWSLDKSQHFFKVSGTNTIAPLDRTVESLGNRTDLDLVRRRFAGADTSGVGGASSPKSSSPNAPLFLTPESQMGGVGGGRSRKGTGSSAGRQYQYGGAVGAHPLAQAQDAFTLNPSGVLAGGGYYKKYTVVRKQPMSFAPSHTRTLLLDGDYMHILPPDSGKGLFETSSSAKTTTVPINMIFGCKVSRRHPKTFRVMVYRENEQKRYDFEAHSVHEAQEIVNEIRKGVEPLQPKLL